MIKYKYSTVIEIGDIYEFCIKEENEPSKVMYGKVVNIDKNKKSFSFERCENTIRRGKFIPKPTGEIYEDVTAIRGVGLIDKDTWK